MCGEWYVVGKDLLVHVYGQIAAFAPITNVRRKKFCAPKTDRRQRPNNRFFFSLVLNILNKINPTSFEQSLWGPMFLITYTRYNYLG